MATEECLQLVWRYRLQSFPRGKRLEQRQGHGPIGIREQGQKLREIGFQTGGQLIAEHCAGADQLGAIARQRPQLLGNLRIRQQGTIQRPISAQQGREAPRIPQVGFGAGDAESFPMAVDRFGVNGVDGELLVEQRAHERALGGLERDEDILRILDARPDERHESLQALRGMVNRAGGQRRPGVVHQTIDMLGIRPIDPDQQHRLSPPDSGLRAPCAASPQPSMRAALRARLPIAGRMPRRSRER